MTRKFSDSIRTRLALFLCFIGLSFPQALYADGFTITCEESQVTIEYDGKLVTQYHFRDKDARKPYFWPVIGPKGKSMTRAYPMEKVDCGSPAAAFIPQPAVVCDTKKDLL